MASSILLQLAATPATELPRSALNGVRPVQILYEKCLEAGIAKPGARDDVERLLLLFDIALAHGLGSIILDYVLEVCSDPFFTSR